MLIIEPMMKSFKDWVKGGGLAGMFGGSGTPSDVPPGGPYSKGGVFDSPSLSRYSGGIYNSPRFFTFAKGGMFAEAGPEAIMPLKRGPGGELGVDTSGAGGDVTVNVYNETRSEVKTTSRPDMNGNRVIEIMVKDAVSSSIRSGAFDAVMGTTYGLNRLGAR